MFANLVSASLLYFQVVYTTIEQLRISLQ